MYAPEISLNDNLYYRGKMGGVIGGGQIVEAPAGRLSGCGGGDFVGHYKSTRNGPVTLLYGNGCPRHPDCFTCPFDDCTHNICGHKDFTQKASRKGVM